MARVCLVKNRGDDPFPIGGVQLQAGDLAAVLVQDDECLVRVNRAGTQVVPRQRELDRGQAGLTELDNTAAEYFDALQQRSTTLLYERQPDIQGPAREVALQFSALFRTP